MLGTRITYFEILNQSTIKSRDLEKLFNWNGNEINSKNIYVIRHCVISLSCYEP